MSDDTVSLVQTAMNEAIGSAVGMLISTSEAAHLIEALGDLGISLSSDAPDDNEVTVVDDQVITLDVSDRLYDLLTRSLPPGGVAISHSETTGAPSEAGA